MAVRHGLGRFEIFRPLSWSQLKLFRVVKCYFNFCKRNHPCDRTPKTNAFFDMLCYPRFKKTWALTTEWLVNICCLSSVIHPNHYQLIYIFFSKIQKTTMALHHSHWSCGEFSDRFRIRASAFPSASGRNHSTRAGAVAKDSVATKSSRHFFQNQIGWDPKGQKIAFQPPFFSRGVLVSGRACNLQMIRLCPQKKVILDKRTLYVQKKKINKHMALRMCIYINICVYAAWMYISWTMIIHQTETGWNKSYCIYLSFALRRHTGIGISVASITSRYLEQIACKKPAFPQPSVVSYVLHMPLQFFTVFALLQLTSTFHPHPKVCGWAKDTGGNSCWA